jgi:hypothetical protein
MSCFRICSSQARVLTAFLAVAALAPVRAVAQAPARAGLASKAAGPEMQRVADVLAGDWATTESMERSDLFPDGGARRGTSRWRLAVGGTTLVGEGKSNGSAGPLGYLITIWWDAPAAVYRFFTCFTDAAGSSCRVRGTAHWEGDAFVNDYEETGRAGPVRWRDSFVRLTPSSHTLLAARLAADGSMQTLITSRSVRVRAR